MLLKWKLGGMLLPRIRGYRHHFSDVGCDHLLLVCHRVLCLFGRRLRFPIFYIFGDAYFNDGFSFMHRSKLLLLISARIWSGALTLSHLQTLHQSEVVFFFSVFGDEGHHRLIGISLNTRIVGPRHLALLPRFPLLFWACWRIRSSCLHQGVPTSIVAPNLEALVVDLLYLGIKLFLVDLLNVKLPSLLIINIVVMVLVHPSLVFIQIKLF